MTVDRDALVQAFLVDSDENLSSMEEALMALEAHPDDEDVLHTIFRGAHTMKGNASTIGYGDMAELAHLVEDVLDRLRKRLLRASADLISVLLRAVDSMRQMAPTATSPEHMLKAPEALVRELADWKTSAPLPVAPPSPPLDVGFALWDVDPEPTQAPADPFPETTAPSPSPETPAEATTPSPPPEAPAAPAASTDTPRTRTLRVDLDRLDQVLTLVGEIAIARGRLLSTLEKVASTGMLQPIEIHREADRLFLDLQDLVLRIRIVPLGPTCRQYARTVRDLATAHGKQARLVVEGGEVEVDMAVIEHLRDPLTHIVRNSISHAIEPSAERQSLGKDPCGLITIRARRASNNILLQVIDDGRGIDRKRVLEVARARGLVTATATPRDGDLLHLIFEPGFSTAREVGDLSGRGFGMDIVRRHMDALRGTVDVESTPGQGTTVTLRIPLTLAIIPGFAVTAGGGTYVLPMESVVECVDFPRGVDVPESGLLVLSLRGRPLPCLRLRQLFSLTGQPSRRENVVVVRSGDTTAGLIVDALEGQTQAVVKPLGRYMGELNGIAGSTILGSGRVALILDVASILRHASAAATAPS